MAATLLLHDRQRRMRAVQEAEEVDVDHPPPVFGVGAEDRAEQHDARVVHEHVDRAEFVLRRPDQRTRRRLIRHVGRNCKRLSTAARDLLRELVDSILAARSERDRIAGAGKRPRRRLTNPGRGPRYHCDSISHAPTIRRAALKLSGPQNL